MTRLPTASERALLPGRSTHVAELRRAEARSPSEDIVSTSTQQFSGQAQIQERRTHPRVLPKTLIYVACGGSNGGMVLNVSDDGMAISMAIPVGDESYSNVHVRMNGLAHAIEVHGRMAWTTKSKKRAGIQLVDVSDEQRSQICEWLAREGVRDVNLLPRVTESAAAVLPPPPGTAVTPSLREDARSNLSPVAASAVINSAVLAEPQTSLLAGLGGTTPEFLGPALDEPSFAENTIAEAKPSQGSNPVFAGFREKEWDLASVTMVPRKRSKPEGLSALGLLLLWIAIPSFGIGLIVGRRPLQQWLSHEGALRKNISAVTTPESEIASTRDESPDITSSDIDATGAQPPARKAEAASTASQDVKMPAATKSFVSTPAVVDTKLLNSMSTQELRAIKSPASVSPPENPNANELSKMDSKAKPNTVAKVGFSSPAAVVKPVTGADTFAPSTNAATNAGNASAQPGDSKDKSAVALTAHNAQSIAANKTDSLAQGISKQNSSDQVARTISVDSGVNARTSIHPGVAPSNQAALRSPVSAVSSTTVPRTDSNSTATASAAPDTANSITPQNTSSTLSIQAIGTNSDVSSQSANHSATPVSRTAGNSTATSSSVSNASRNDNTVLSASKTQPASAASPTTMTRSDPAATKPGSYIASDASPRIAPSVRPETARPDTGSTATAGTAAKVPPTPYASSSSRSAAPGVATNLAPVNAQSPLHGVMLVARKNNESFLLRLPVESVAGGRSASVERQRFVMVPAESRWHHHGPIAKLTVGELLTQVSANQGETINNARPGDAVTVRAFVDKNGSVQDLKPVSGRFALMPRVMHDVREWQFDQTLIDGKPVESEVNITVEFRSNAAPQPNRAREIQAQNSFKP